MTQVADLIADRFVSIPATACANNSCFNVSDPKNHPCQIQHTERWPPARRVRVLALVQFVPGRRPALRQL